MAYNPSALDRFIERHTIACYLVAVPLGAVSGLFIAVGLWACVAAPVLGAIS